MTFKIVVCIKQVPDTNDIKWTPMNTIQREGMDSVINPFDLGAIQFALDLKKRFNDAQITLVSMGPKQAEESLRYGLALGADEAYLLCDKKFAASDTLATAYCLSCFVGKYVSDFNLIICGQQAVDGDTAQTPSALAEKLSIPSVTLVSELKFVDREHVVLVRDLPSRIEEVQVALPSLLAINSQSIFKMPKIEDFMRAQDQTVKVLGLADIGADDGYVGIKGSPTQVRNAFRSVKSREGNILAELSVSECVNSVLTEISRAKL